MGMSPVLQSSGRARRRGVAPVRSSDSSHAVRSRRSIAAWPTAPQGTHAILVGMLLSLALFYRGSPQLPVTATGLALFAVLAILRPDLALRFVPLTVPLFFMPKGIWDARFGIRDSGMSFPLHEVVLLVTATAASIRWGWRRLRAANHILLGAGGQIPAAIGARLGQAIRANALYGLFLLVGTLGVFAAQPDGRSVALREWRWLIAEPVVFYGLVRILTPRTSPAAQTYQLPSMLYPFLTGGALVGLLGILQFLGLNLVPYIGSKVGFSDDRIFVEGVQRVSSVYGHPNNLGLYMDRVWPVAAALWLSTRSPLRAYGFNKGAGNHQGQWSSRFFATVTLLAIGGMIVSFSKGALFGGLAAVAVLMLALRERWWVAAIGAASGLLIVGAFVLDIERINPFGMTSSVRLSTWGSALAMLRDHPIFGIGLDQFGRLYPQYIAPELAATNERFTAHPHNLLLDIWLRMGLLGLMVFGCLLLRFYRQCRPALTHPDTAPLGAGLGAAMAAALVHGLVDNFYFVPDLAFAFWLALALIAPTGHTPPSSEPTPR